jgi:hypothetical protein
MGLRRKEPLLWEDGIFIAFGREPPLSQDDMPCAARPPPAILAGKAYGIYVMVDNKNPAIQSGPMAAYRQDTPDNLSSWPRCLRLPHDHDNQQHRGSALAKASASSSSGLPPVGRCDGSSLLRLGRDVGPEHP